MKIIGSGFGRTGTMSLKEALEILGFGPCYHMETVIKRPSNINTWHQISQGTPTDWQAVFQGYNATVDFPGSLFYKELLVAFPDAKVIHSVRDPLRWYNSTMTTIFQTNAAFPTWLRDIFPPLGRFMEMQNILIWQNLFENRFADKERALEIFAEFTADVERSVPADQLLVFEVKQGWEPLCDFLAVPIPDVPFPHVNDRSKFMRRLQLTKAAMIGGLIMPIVLAALLFYFVFRERKLA